MAEKDHEDGNTASGGLGPDDPAMDSLKKMRTASSVQMSPELFEKLYLSPPNAVRGGLRKTFGNPTPIALIGFLISLSTLSNILMGWRGASGLGNAETGVYFFMGGLLLVLGSILEWVLGNSFASIVFATFGGFWFSFGATLTPSFFAYGSYAPQGGSEADGLQAMPFNASLGFWWVYMGLIVFIFMICSLRTNLAFFLIFFSLDLAFWLLTAWSWALSDDYTGNAGRAMKLLKGAGGCAFVTCISGWYLLTALMLAVVDFPIQLPVGDLSSVIKGKSQRKPGASRDKEAQG